MRKTGAQSLTTLTVQDREWKRTARASAVAHPGAIASSGTVWKGSKATQVGPPSHVGCAAIPSSRRSIWTQLSATTYLSEASVYIQQALHHVYVLPIHRSEAGSARQAVANNIDSTGIEKWKRTARASAVAPVLPLQVVELSEGEVEATQVGPPLYVLGAQVDPVKSQIDLMQLSATTYM
jgi:hypothetical protein